MVRNLYFLALASLFSLTSFAASFTSTTTGNWNNPATWTVVGLDSDGIPDADDDVTISGVTVTLNLASNFCRDLTISSGTFNLNNRVLRIYGDLTRTGGTILGSAAFHFYASPGTITGLFTSGGNWYFPANSDITIDPSTVIQKSGTFNLYSGTIVTNQGLVRLTGGGISYNTASGTWINAAGSTLQVSANFTGTGTLDCSANPNTMIFNGAAITGIRRTTYHHLTIQNCTSAPILVNATYTINGNLRIVGSGSTLDCNNISIDLAGNWTNTANTSCLNMATVTFLGGGTQTITRPSTERFNDLTVSTTGTVQLATGILLTGDLLLSTGTFDVTATNYSVNVRGDFTNDGVNFMANQGTFTLSGTAVQTIGGAGSTQFYNITTTNTTSVNVTGTVSMENLLSVNAGSFGTAGAGTFTLLANGSVTYANIGPLGATSTLTGTGWINQSYINGPATGYWQFLGTSINGNILNDWDSDTRFYMSGVGGNDGNACCPTFRSVRTYNTAGGNWVNVTTIATALVSGQGFMVWMSDNNQNLTAPLIYDDRGTPNFGDITYAVTAGGGGGGFNLVSNPYACPITFSAVVAASGNLGASFSILQENGTYVTDPNGGVIAPHQGYMCVATSTGNMTNTEACKNTTVNPNIIRQAQEQNYLRINVSNDVNGLGGETAVRLVQDAHNGFDLAYDMPFIANVYDEATNLWTTDADRKDNLLNVLDAADVLEIPLSVKAAVSGNQMLAFRGLAAFGGYSCAWLEDESTGKRVNLFGQDTYSYYSEVGETRTFLLHFDHQGTCPTDVAMTPSLDASTQVFVNNGQLKAQFFFNSRTSIRVAIYDVEGREVSGLRDYEVGNEIISLENPGAHGVYFVTVFQGDTQVTKKIYY